MESTLQNRGSS